LRNPRKQSPAAYREYLAIQLRRTLRSARRILVSVPSRSSTELPSNGRTAAASFASAANTLELDRFRARGFDEVTGIAVFSQRHDIKVIDVHEMTFPDPGHRRDRSPADAT
jgi:hypothetical protein